MEKSESEKRIVKAVHANAKVEADPAWELGMAEHLRGAYTSEELLSLFGDHSTSNCKFDFMMRRIIWRALCKSCGHGAKIESGVTFKHIETFEIGDNVFLGAQTFIQGRFDGRCRIGNNVWIGPQSYFDARDLTIEDYVGWGPGAKVVGSEHTGLPLDVPILKTDLEILPVRIGEWADIGTNAVILPGVTIGKGAIVAAGAVVTKDVEPFTVVAGVPAKFLKKRQ